MDHDPALYCSMMEVSRAPALADPTATQDDATHDTDESPPDGSAGLAITDHAPPLSCSISGPVGDAPTATHSEDDTHDTEFNVPVTAGTAIADQTPPASRSMSGVEGPLEPTAMQESGEVHETPPSPAEASSGKLGLAIADHTPPRNCSM
jgi:hypothetical protein